MLLCCAGSNAQDSQEIYEIGGITVIGNTNTDKELILNRAGLKVGDSITFPSTKVHRAMKALWSMKLFADVQIIKNNTVEDIVFLEIILEEKKRLHDFSFTGVKKVHEEELTKLVNAIVLKGEIVSKSQKLNLTEKIKNFYTEKGYLDVVCDIKENNVEENPNQFDILFQISKGEKVKINHIAFPHSQIVDHRKLRKQMKHTHVIKINPFSTAKLIDEHYEQDKKNLIDYYNSLGYRDARITKDSIYRNEKNELHIDIYIEEGKPYYIGEIAFKGNSIYSDEILAEVLGIQKGDIYNSQILESNIHLNPTGLDISALYMDNGYLFFQVELVETGVVGDAINIQIDIQEGRRATIGKVSISGNTKTKEHIIRRELRTKPGNLFSRADIIRSQREIINLGFFEPEALGINTEVNPQNGTVDIEYIVKEKNSAQIELSGGWGGSNIGPTGSVGLSLNNFSLSKLMQGDLKTLPQGDGQTLSLRAQTNGINLQSYNFSFSEPWLGGKKPNRLNLGGYYTRWTNGEAKSSADFGSLKIAGASLGLGTRLRWPDDNFVSFSTLNFKQITLQNWETDGFTTENGMPITDGVFNDLSFKQSISRSTINHPLFPTGGSRISLTGEFTLPYSLLQKGSQGIDPSAIPSFIEYHKWRLDAEWYKPVVGKLVFKASAKMGLLGTYGKQQSASPFGQFILGGDGLSAQSGGGILAYDLISLRGYDPEELSANTSGGATVFNKFTAELRYPVLTSPGANAWILAFAEAGNSWDSLSSYNPFKLKRSAGLGIRVHVPAFGTLGFDYGIGFDRDNITSGAGLFNNYGKVSIILGTEPD